MARSFGRTSKAKEAVDRIVLGTVNSSWKHVINVDTLVSVIREPQQADQWLPHVATFFAEVRPDTVLQFASYHHVPVRTLKRSYAWVKSRTGEHNRALEAEFG
jgi:hypothetical protein